MARVCQWLCVVLCSNAVVCQFGFFQDRGNRRYQQNDYGQSFLSGPRRIANLVSGFFQPENNRRFGPFTSDYDQQRPIVNSNQYDITANQYLYEQPNNVRFPGQNSPNGYYQQGYQTNDNINTDDTATNNAHTFPNPQNSAAPDYVVVIVDGEQADAGSAAPPTNAPFDAENEPNNPIPTVAPPYVQNEPITPPNNALGFLESDQNTGLISGSVTKEKLPFPSFEDRNIFGGASSPAPPALAPVAPSETRSLNFETQGAFQPTCDTVDGDVGSCLSVVDCEPYIKLLQQARNNPTVVQKLRKAHCGFEGNNPKVCCPRPGIPDASPPEVTTKASVVSPSPATTNAAAKSTGNGDYISGFPEPPVCGVSHGTFSKVVGGVNASLGDFPWMALLGYKGSRGNPTRFLCGGSLISSHHVLTAAHCVHNRENDLYVVRLGELDLAREDEGATPVDVLIKTKIKHEDYNPKSFGNDIAVLVLERDVEFTKLIHPICVPAAGDVRSNNYVNYNPFIAGWGDTEFRGPSATRLQVLQLPVVSNDACSAAYSPYSKQISIDDRVLCAGYKQGGKDACQGDSGGPLMQPIWNPQTYDTFFYQIGVVSFGKKCAEPGFPGVYTRVTHFVSWLQQTVLGK